MISGDDYTRLITRIEGDNHVKWLPVNKMEQKARWEWLIIREVGDHLPFRKTLPNVIRVQVSFEHPFDRVPAKQDFLALHALSLQS